MNSAFTCITCKVAFKDPDVQRQHYKSDWHRYNLKRKIVELSPITAEEFQGRVLKQQGKDAEIEKDKSVYCTTCYKNFVCLKSYENHLNSKRHKEKVENSNNRQINSKVEDGVCMKRIVSKFKEAVLKDKTVEEESEVETDSEIEEISSDEWNEDDENNPVNKNNCLFCNRHSRNLVVNLKHMSEAHSFFIPDVEYCIDMRGLLLYLGSKIVNGHLCLWCNEKSKTFLTTEAVQKHMIDKGHTKMYHMGEALLEYIPYYDYSTSYPDNEIRDPDDEVEIPDLDGTGYQLVLPSGSIIGHRSLIRYYKQNLNPKHGMLVKHKVNQVLSNYKQFGYTPVQKEIAQRKERDIRYMQRVQQKFYTKVGCKANKLQKHFRPQVNF